MGANAIAFIRALGLRRVDVLGFSIGGFVAQEIALQAPDLVRRLVLVGTGPRSGQGMATLTLEAQEIFGAVYRPPLASSALHAIREEPSCGPRVPQALPPARREPRSRGQRESRARPDRGDRQMGRTAG